MRKLIVAVGAVLAVVVMASAAMAKTPGKAVISGPGLAAPLRIDFRGDNDGSGGDTFFEVLQGVGLFEGYRDDAAPEGVALGPKYQMMVFIGMPGEVPSTVEVDLYPYAKDGPVSFTADGQSAREFGEVRGGWHTSNSYFFDTLVDLGLPARAPGAAPAAGQPPAVPPSPSPWIWVVSVVGLGLLLVAGALVARPRRRAATA